MKIAMIGIASKPSTALFSHNGGWTYTLKSILQKTIGNVDIVTDPIDIHNYDALCINEGLNYKKGSWNFFGGMQEYSLEMLQQLNKYQGKVYCFNEDICWESLIKRKEIRDVYTSKYDFPEVKTILTSYKTDKIIIGDSHSVSIYEPGYAISRNDGATLYGSLKESGLLRKFNFDGYKNIVLYFGNIDIRFHIHRQGGLEALDQLIKDYVFFIDTLIQKGFNITVQGLLPIEDESRKIPGTGLYKEKPYYGSSYERQSYVDYFNTTMKDNSNYYGFNFRMWDLPLEGFKAPKFKCMESRQSVHLRPEYYLFKDKLISNAESVLRLL